MASLERPFLNVPSPRNGTCPFPSAFSQAVSTTSPYLACRFGRRRVVDAYRTLFDHVLSGPSNAQPTVSRIQAEDSNPPRAQ
jgi:hypothetical protein